MTVGQPKSGTPPKTITSRLKRIARAAVRRITGQPPPPAKKSRGKGAKRLAMLARGEHTPDSEIKQIYATRARYLTPISQPLLMISQIQRSGGSLLSQLLDNHPECYNHPDELYLGFPDKFTYPTLNLAAGADEWYTQLREEHIVKLYLVGYKKNPKNSDNDVVDTFPFLLLPNLQRELFMTHVAARNPKTQREVLDCYFTSFFNAWVDYAGFAGPKKYVTGFIPRIANDAANVERYFTDYPDGRLVQIVRDPQGWYASAHKHKDYNYPDVESGMPYWVRSVESMLANKAKYGDRVRLLSFDALLSDTENVMRRLADWAGLTWHDTLTEPTFQGLPIKANTVFKTNEYGIIDEPRQRGNTLSPEDAAAVEASGALALYEQVLAQCQ